MEDEFQNELLKELLIESFEGLDTYDQEMIALENGSGGADSIRTIFRIIHTLKGGAGFVGLGKIEALAHDGENLLSLLRDEKLEVRTDIVSALLELSDALRGLLDHLESEGEEGEGDFTELLEKLKALQVSPEEQAAAPEETPVYEMPASEVEEESSQESEETELAAAAQAEPVAVPNPAPKAEAVSAVKEEPEPKSEPDAKSKPKNSVAESAIRVDVNQLDKLMNLVGELVLARNQILQFSGNSQEDGLNSASQRLNIITTELQESVMKTRMQHIGNVWSKFPRVVLVRLEEDQIETAVEMIYGTPVYRLRGELLPLVYLNTELKIESIQQETVDSLDEAINIVVLQADGRQFGLVVDAINDTEEIVVKPLGKQFKNLSFYAGATIMGDGRVALILDVMGVAQRAGVISEGKDQITIASMDDKHTGQEGKSSLLVIENENQTRMAIPLNIVSRLEEIPVTKVEHTGDRDVVQYREEIMPLVWVADYVTGIGGRPQADEDNNMQAVVFTENKRSVGLVVNKIEDIVEQSFSVQRATHQQGVLGSAVIQDRVTQLLDVEGIVKQADPLFFEERSEESLIQS